MIISSAVLTLLKPRPGKNSDFERVSTPTTSAVPDAVLSQLSYQSHMIEVVTGLALYVDVILGPSIVNKVYSWVQIPFRA